MNPNGPDKCEINMQVPACEAVDLQRVLHLMVENAVTQFAEALKKKGQNPELERIISEGSVDLNPDTGGPEDLPGSGPRISHDEFPG